MKSSISSGGGRNSRDNKVSTPRTTTSNSNTLNELDTDPDVLRQEELFKYLGLRHLGKLQSSATFSTALGYVLIATAALSFIGFLYATYFSKILPFTGIEWLDAIKRDRYFCYLIPLSLLPTSILLYIHWLAKRHFQQN